MSTLQAILLAILEGLTEFLPISSTGHMIVASSLMGIDQSPFLKTFLVAIQPGAILAVLVMYLQRFLSSLGLYFKLAVAFLPAAIIGFLLGDYIDALLERVEVVGIMLLLGGIFFLFVDGLFKKSIASGTDEITYKTAWKIGLFQSLALIPGVSRSAATIIGGLAQGVNKKSAAEFSFFLAVPTMMAATGYVLFKLYKSGGGIHPEEIQILLVGFGVAFITALFALKWFIAFLIRHGFRYFGYYRILVGLCILALHYFGITTHVL